MVVEDETPHPIAVVDATGSAHLIRAALRRLVAAGFVADVRQASTMNYLVQGREVIFNLAGQVSHIDSMRDPYQDLEINCRSQLTILEACRRNNPAVKVVYAGTRQVYGHPDTLPVTEDTDLTLAADGRRLIAGPSVCSCQRTFSRLR